MFYNVKHFTKTGRVSGKKKCFIPLVMIFSVPGERNFGPCQEFKS